MLPDRADSQAVAAVRAILDSFDVGGRLQYIRDFIWRGGTLRLETSEAGDAQPLNVWYSLSARWPAAVLESESNGLNGLARWHTPVVEGRWVRSMHGYELRVGIDLRTPSAVYIWAGGFRSHVPYLKRPRVEVESALQGELQVFVAWFVEHCEPVPQKAAADAKRLRQLGLAA